MRAVFDRDSRRAAATKLAAMIFSVGGPPDPPPLQLPSPAAGPGAAAGRGEGWFNDSVAIARLLVQRQVRRARHESWGAVAS